MKKTVFTSAALQSLKKDSGVYTPANDPALLYEVPNSYPVLALLNACVKTGDAISLHVLVTEGDSISEENFDIVSRLAMDLCHGKGAECTVASLLIPKDDSPNTQLLNFEKLISLMKGSDSLLCDITYGTKCNAIVMMLAMNFGYRVLGIDCEKMVYGAYNFKTGEKTIYNISSLFRMDQIVNTISGFHSSDPVGLIQSILCLSDDKEEQN